MELERRLALDVIRSLPAVRQQPPHTTTTTTTTSHDNMASPRHIDAPMLEPISGEYDDDENQPLVSSSSSSSSASRRATDLGAASPSPSPSRSSGGFIPPPLSRSYSSTLALRRTRYTEPDSNSIVVDPSSDDELALQTPSFSADIDDASYGFDSAWHHVQRDDTAGSSATTDSPASSLDDNDDHRGTSLPSRTQLDLNVSSVGIDRLLIVLPKPHTHPRSHAYTRARSVLTYRERDQDQGTVLHSHTLMVAAVLLVAAHPYVACRASSIITPTLSLTGSLSLSLSLSLASS